MSWKIRYNGFGHSVSGTPASDDWGTLQIDDYRVTPIFDEEEDAVVTHRHSLNGTALISRTSTEAFITAVDRARTVLNVANQDLLIVAIDSGSNLRILADIDPEDSAKEPETSGYPRVEFSVNEFYGELTALVGFTITWETVPFPELPTSNAITHTWSQRFAIDEIGSTTWTVNGEVRIAVNADANSGNPQLNGPNADAYRNLIYPTAPVNFRVETQEYALSPDNSRLLYSIQMKEYGRPLPDPARRGTGTFEYERALAASSLGTKVFDATLHGGPGSDRGLLLATLIKVSKARIRYAGTGADLIESIRVTEEDIFENNAISYRVVAKSMNARALTTSLTQPLVGASTQTIPASQIPAYGDAVIRAVQRGIFLPGDEITAASVEAQDDAGSTSIYQVDETPSEGSFINEIPNGDHSGDGAIQQDALDNPYSVLKSTITVDEQSRAYVLTPAKADAPELAFQTGKAMVTVTERIEIARQNVAPPAVYLKAVPGSVILYDRPTVGAGPIDSNGNRMFTLVHERKYRILDDGTTSRGFFTQAVAIPGIGNVDFRAWNPPGNRVRMPFDPRTESYASAVGSVPFDEHPIGAAFTFTIDLSGAVAPE